MKIEKVNETTNIVIEDENDKKFIIRSNVRLPNMIFTLDSEHSKLEEMLNDKNLVITMSQYVRMSSLSKELQTMIREQLKWL